MSGKKIPEKTKVISTHLLHNQLGNGVEAVIIIIKTSSHCSISGAGVILNSELKFEHKKARGDTELRTWHRYCNSPRNGYL